MLCPNLRDPKGWTWRAIPLPVPEALTCECKGCSGREGTHLAQHSQDEGVPKEEELVADAPRPVQAQHQDELPRRPQKPRPRAQGGTWEVTQNSLVSSRHTLCKLWEEPSEHQRDAGHCRQGDAGLSKGQCGFTQVTR